MTHKHLTILVALLVSACATYNSSTNSTKQQAFDCVAANEEIRNLRERLTLLKEEEKRQKDNVEVAVGAGAAIGSAIGWVMAGGDSTSLVATELSGGKNPNAVKHELIALLKERRNKCTS